MDVFPWIAWWFSSSQSVCWPGRVSEKNHPVLWYTAMELMTIANITLNFIERNGPSLCNKFQRVVSIIPLLGESRGPGSPSRTVTTCNYLLNGIWFSKDRGSKDHLPVFAWIHGTIGSRSRNVPKKVLEIGRLQFVARCTNRIYYVMIGFWLTS